MNFTSAKFNYMLKIKYLTKKNWFWLLSLPVLLNFFFNLINNFESVKNLNLKNLFSTILFFFTFYFLGLFIKEVFDLDTISIGIVFYLLSFLIIDMSFLFITQDISFKNNFLITNLTWFCIVLFKKKFRFHNFSYFFLSYLSLRIFNILNFNSFDLNQNLKGDTWYYFEFCKQILENSFYYSMNNNVFNGYTQFSAYFHSLFFEISFGNNEYIYIRSTTNVLFFLVLLFINELKIDRSIKFFLSSIYTVLVLNSDWLSFLFIDSIMSEGIMNYLFSVLLYNLLNNKTEKSALIFFGFLIFSKQFFITLIYINLFFLISKNFPKKYIIYGLIGTIYKEIAFNTYFSNLQRDHHIAQIDIVDTIFDLILLRDLNLENFLIINKNLFRDIPFTFFLFITLFTVLANIFYKIKLDKNAKIILSNLVINYFLIQILYVSVWRNMELESPIRFILNLFLLLFILLGINISKINQKLKL